MANISTFFKNIKKTMINKLFSCCSGNKNTVESDDVQDIPISNEGTTDEIISDSCDSPTINIHGKIMNKDQDYKSDKKDKFNILSALRLRKNCKKENDESQRDSTRSTNSEDFYFVKESEDE